MKKEKTNRVAGKYLPNSSMGKLFTVLSSGKPKTVDALKKVVKRGINVEHRLYILSRAGKKRGWTVTRDGNKVQLKVRRASLKAA